MGKKKNSGKNLLLIDTFPLLEFLFYQCKERFNWCFLQKKIEILKNRKTVDQFGRFLRKYRVYTTPHVITEIQGHQRNLKKEFKLDRTHHERFWRHSLDELRQIPLTEIHLNNLTI